MPRSRSASTITTATTRPPFETIVRAPPPLSWSSSSIPRRPVPSAPNIRRRWDNRAGAQLGADDRAPDGTDLGDAEGAILAPLLASPTRRGRPRLHDRRLVLDAIAVRAARRSRLAPAARAVPALAECV